VTVLSNTNQTNQINNIEGIIIGISEIKNKTYTFGKKEVTYEMRYIRVTTLNEGEILVRVTDRDFSELPRDKDGNTTQLRNGDVVNFEHFQKEFKFDNGGIMRTNPKIVTVLKHITETAVEKYLLMDTTFYDWGVQLKNNNSICKIPKDQWDVMTGLETTFSLNKLKSKLKIEDLKEAFVEVQANFNLSYRWNINNPFRYHNNGGQVIIITENLLPLKKVKFAEEEIVRTRLLLEEIRTLLQNKMFATYDDIVELARKYTMPEQDVNEYIRSIVWKKNYDEDFTNWLKTRSKTVLYGSEGLFYCLSNNVTVLEDPVTGRASYVFIGDANYIASQIEAIRRENRENSGSIAWREILYRLKKASPEKTNFFVGRVVHYDKEQWMRDMEVVLAEATGKAQTTLKDYPTNPKQRRSTTSQFLQSKQTTTPVKDEYTLEQDICKKCGSVVWVHNKKTPTQHKKILKVYIEKTNAIEENPAYKFCPHCGSTELNWNEEYKANQKGEVID